MKRKQLKAMAAALSLSVAFGLVGSNLSLRTEAATEHWNDASAESTAWENWKANWDTYSSNYENVSLTPGVNETELNFAWYSKTVETPKVKIAKNADMSDAVEFNGAQTTAVEIDGTQYYSNKVTVKNLAENTQYYYQVLKNGNWTQAEKYSTKSFSSFSFLYVGDPQIGASKGQTNTEGDKMVTASNTVTSTAEENLAARNDGYNWNKVLNKAIAEHADVSFMLSAGDQVNYAKNEREYAAYLGADALKSLPVSTTIGNHDSGSNQYTLHYNNPNAFAEEDTVYTTGKTAAGTDYYYTYGNVLFIVLDTNNYNCATHENVIKKAISENKDAKWRVVMFHQDIYGSGLDHSDSDGIVLRTQLTPIFDANDIDVVLQGHDHTYSRTYQLTGDGQQHTAYDSSNYKSDASFLTENNCYVVKSDTKSGTVVNPEGTVYMEANSSTGSKFYNLIQTQQDYIAERSQTWTPSYSVISVDEDSFSITTYDGKTGQELNGSSTYTIVKDERTPQEITGTASYEKKVGDAAFTLDVKAESKLSYESDNEEVAMVSKTGKVNIIGEGTATITVKAEATDTKTEATKTVTIKVSKADVVKEVKSQNIQCEDSYTKAYGNKAFSLNAKTDGNGALSYTSSDTKIVTVDSTGKVTIKGVGIATITVKAASTDDYNEAVATVNITVNPKSATISKVTSTKAAQAKVTWKKDTKATGYQVVYASNKSFTKNVTTVLTKKNTTVSLTMKKLTSKKKVYVKIRSYKVVDGKVLYGNYSKVKSVTVK